MAMLIGATGAVELLACILALRDGIVPPTIGLQGPDPDCALDVVTGYAQGPQPSARPCPMPLPLAV